MRGTLIAAAAATLLTAASAAVDPIVIKGSKFFFKSNGTQFFMKGVAYQRTSSSVIITIILILILNSRPMTDYLQRKSIQTLHKPRTSTTPTLSPTRQHASATSSISPSSRPTPFVSMQSTPRKTTMSA
jgi:hypothetical protein